MSTEVDLQTAIHLLAATSEVLQRSVERAAAEWAPDPPAITFIFTEVGRDLSRQQNALSPNEVQAAWSVVENLLQHGNQSVKDAVATGLVEAVVSEVDSGRSELSGFRAFLGKKTIAYWKAWDAFNGCQTKGL